MHMAEKRRRPADRAAPVQVRDKLAFLISLVPWLLDNDRVTVAEAAAHFDVDEKQIREAVTLVALSGVPGETAAYLPGDLFDIDWDAFDRGEIAITHHVAIDEAPRLSAREAAALIAGLRYLQVLPENASSLTLRTLVDKLSRGASAAPSALAVADGPSRDALDIVQSAMSQGRRLAFTYVNSRDAREVRAVDPLRVESIDNDLYLRGWCHLRGAVRTFRFDRMSDIAITDTPIEHDVESITLSRNLFEPSADDLIVTIEATPESLALLTDYLADDSSFATVGDRVRTTIRVSHYHGLKRLIASMPGAVRVVEPEQAREIVSEWASAGLARYA